MGNCGQVIRPSCAFSRNSCNRKPRALVHDKQRTGLLLTVRYRTAVLCAGLYYEALNGGCEASTPHSHHSCVAKNSFNLSDNTKFELIIVFKPYKFEVLSAYQDNFEERRIFAFIGYKNQIEPTSLLITTYTNDNARDKIEERYDKTRTNLVKCTRGIFKDDKRVAYYTKEQTEDKEAQWIELTLGTLLKHTTSASSSKNAKTTKAAVRFNGGKKLPLQTHMS